MAPIRETVRKKENCKMKVEGKFKSQSFTFLQIAFWIIKIKERNSVYHIDAYDTLSIFKNIFHFDLD